MRAYPMTRTASRSNRSRSGSWGPRSRSPFPTRPAARLDAWLDFNGDGSWGGPLEQIADNVLVVNGSNVLTFDVPSTAADRTAIARFRLSTAGNLGVRGVALDGEVEDHTVTISPPAATGGVFGNPNTISTAADGARSVFAADVDGDGDTDVLIRIFY